MQKLFEKGLSLYKKHKEVIDYTVIGGMTTVVNYVVYFVWSRLFGNILTANTVAWLVAVVFAFFANKLFVFRVGFSSPVAFLRELLLFAGARVFSGVVEMLMLAAGTLKLGINDLVVKVAAAVVIIVMNYFLSKFVVFAKPKKETPQNEEAFDSNPGL